MVPHDPFAGYEEELEPEALDGPVVPRNAFAGYMEAEEAEEAEEAGRQLWSENDVDAAARWVEEEQRRIWESENLNEQDYRWLAARLVERSRRSLNEALRRLDLEREAAEGWREAALDCERKLATALDRTEAAMAVEARLRRRVLVAEARAVAAEAQVSAARAATAAAVARLSNVEVFDVVAEDEVLH